MIVSVPSWVIPGTYLDNVRFLAGGEPRIRAIEFLFFRLDAETETLLLRERSAISAFRGRFDFSVHMPDTLEAGDERIIELTADLCDRYIVHAPPPERFGEIACLILKWRRRYGKRFLLENCVGRNFPGALRALEPDGICLDTGHLLLEGGDPRAFIDRYAGRVEEIHLHGVRGGKDHKTFAREEPWFQGMLPFLRDFGGVVNIELFLFSNVTEIIALFADKDIGLI